MRKALLLLVLLLTTVTGFAQFTLDNNAADEYLRKKAEQAEARRIQDSIRQAQLEEQQMMASDIRYRMKWTNILTYRQTIGVIENGYNLSYYGYLKTRSAWSYPISIRLSGSKSYNDANMHPGYKDWSQSLSYWGLSGIRNLKDNWYLSLGGHLPLGWERFRYDGTDGEHELELSSEKRHFHLLAGLNVEERLLYMSPDKVGLVMGVGFYQRLMNSKTYTFDVGFSLEVGLKF
ncbi:MAG: hypothetical protein ABFC90_09390 [Bacteroidales bacterium]|nr:hypothetical protein [Bacteroidales bacterium]